MAKYLKPDIKSALETGFGYYYAYGREITYTSDPIHVECTSCPFVNELIVTVACGAAFEASVRSKTDVNICEAGSAVLDQTVKRFVHDEIIAPQNAHNN